MDTLHKVVLTLTLSLSAGVAGAHVDTYWVDRAGNYVSDGDGHCLHTSNWRSGNDCTETDADNTPVAPVKAAAPVATPAPVMKHAEPIKTSPAPKYRQLSLESGASFELGGSTLSSAGKASVADLLAKFKGENIKQVIVEGHTDDRGPAAFNQQLSEKRAQAVKAELVANGIDAQVIQTTGYGESRPVADNGSADGRGKNRRVEIKIDAEKRKF